MSQFKTLFDQHARRTIQANDLHQEAYQALDPIFRGFLKEGYSPREIGHIIILAVLEMEMTSILELSEIKNR